MKQTISILIASLILSLPTFAKDIKTLVVKTSPEMHCNGCETKIKNNIRFTAGVKKIDTDLSTKQVTIQYDADKTDAKAIVKAFDKIGYKATVVSDKNAESKKQPVDGSTAATQTQKKK